MITSLLTTQRLIEQYPIVVARHFNKRVELLFQFITNHDKVIGRYACGVELKFKIEEHFTYMPDKNSPLHDIAKKTQVHRHTFTCYKNGSQTCRFTFPKKECKETRIIATSSFTLKKES